MRLGQFLASWLAVTLTARFIYLMRPLSTVSTGRVSSALKATFSRPIRNHQLYHFRMDESVQQAVPETALPKLSATDFRLYNKMAEHMNYYHDNFRATWKMLYAACSSGKRPANISLRQFISTVEQLCHHLTMHHTIEEQHIFPVGPCHVHYSKWSRLTMCTGSGSENAGLSSRAGIADTTQADTHRPGKN